MILCCFFAFARLHFSEFFFVDFVSNEKYRWITCRALFYLLVPTADAIEAFPHGQVVHNDKSTCVSEEWRNHWAKAFLPCRVPKLETYALAVALNDFCEKVDSYSWLHFFSKTTVDELVDERSLSDALIPKQDGFAFGDRVFLWTLLLHFYFV